jgi:hypothetical protein
VTRWVNRHGNWGLWLDASDREHTTAGCTICDDEWAGPYDAVVTFFEKHTHRLSPEILSALRAAAVKGREGWRDGPTRALVIQLIDEYNRR